MRKALVGKFLVAGLGPAFAFGFCSLAHAAPPEDAAPAGDAADDAADDSDAPAEDADAAAEDAEDASGTAEDAAEDAEADAEGPVDDETEDVEPATTDAEVAPEGPAEVDADVSTDAESAAPAECDCEEEAPALVPDPTHVTDFNLSAGGLLTTGNANTLAVTGKLATTVRRGKHQFTGGYDGNYGMSRANLDAEWLPTTANMEGRARYDGFFVDWATGFLATTARHDPFQGLNVRWTLDPGVTFYALQREKHTLKFDVGYELQVDGRRRGNILLKDDDGLVILDDMGNATRDPELDPVFVNHSLRLAGNYEFKLNDSVKYRLGTEYFQSLLFAEEADRWRINGETGLDVSLVAGLGLGLSFQIRYDNKPLPDIQKLDTFSNVTLTYTFKGKAKMKKPPDA